MSESSKELWRTMQQIIVTLSALILVACDDSAEAGAVLNNSDLQRHTELRARLQSEFGESYNQLLPATSGDQLAGGALLWSHLCAGCHGETGRAARSLSRALPIQPADLSDPVRAAFFSARAKLHIVSEGIPGTPMIGWKSMLSEAEMVAVLAHLQTLVRDG